jgi:hypothetical protein
LGIEVQQEHTPSAPHGSGSERLDGVEVEKDTVVPSPQITAANVDEFYDPNSEF